MNRLKTFRRLACLLIALSLAGYALGSTKPRYPIEQATQKGDIKLVKDLLAKGQSQYRRDSALRFAIRAGHREIVELLISHGAKFALLKAAEEGNIELVKHFLNQGQEKDACDSALHGATRNGHKQIVELLLSHGADVNSLRWGGFTPLFYAVTMGGDHNVLTRFTNSILSSLIEESRDTKQSPASQKEFVDIVELLIEKGADVNVKKKQLGFVPLHYAIFGGNVEIVEALLNNGAEVNPETKSAKISSHYITPLHLAACYGDVTICKLLIERGAQVNSKMPTGRGRSRSMYRVRQTPLHYAACSHNTKLVELLIKHGAEVDATDHYDMTPLHFAVFRKDLSITNLLLTHGADVNATDHYGMTPLHNAAQNRDLIAVRILLSHGADSNPKNHKGQTPTSIAVRNGSTEIVKLLTAKHGQVTIHSAASMGDIETMERLVKKGVNVNRTNLWGKTALHSAIVAGQVSTVSWLLAHGADPNCPNDKDITPLSISLRIAQSYCFSRDPNEVARFKAIKRKQRDILALLIEHGASPGFAYGIPRKIVLSHPTKVADMLIDAGPNFEPHYDSKATLLHRAAWWGEKEVVEDLIELGADVEAIDSVGGTPLHAAIQNGCTHYWDVIHGPNIEILELLIKNGADVNATNKGNTTPLHGAAGYNDANAVELLIEHRADVNAIDNAGQTPLHKAAYYGFTDIMDLLITKGADPNIADNKRNTPLLLLLSSHQLIRDETEREIIDYVIKLAKRGVKVNVQNHKGVTPLQQAAAMGYPDLLDAFLIRGAPVKLKSNTGWTALHSAVASGNAECVEMLLKHNAEVNILGTLPGMIRLPRLNWPARTPLHIAVSQRHNTIIPLLIASGADVNAADGDKKTPLQIAVKINNLEAVKLLLDQGADSNVQPN